MVLVGRWGGDRMRIASRLALILIGCFSSVLCDEAPATEFVIFPSQPPPPINSPAFAVRAPLPGRPGYLETIKFIDDGVRYVDPVSHFYISAAGEMCFHTPPSYPKIYTNARGLFVRCISRLFFVQ